MKNDTIMTGFEFGDPSRPFVMGSIYTISTGAGGALDNNVKSLTDKAGNYMKMDAGSGLVQLFSKSGNSILVMDGAGNVSITTPNSITLNGMDIILNASNTINLNATNIINLNTIDVNINGSNSINLKAEPLATGGEGIIDMKAKKKISATAETEDITLKAQAKNITLESEAAEVSIKAKTNMLIEATAKLEVKTPDMKVEH